RNNHAERLNLVDAGVRRVEGTGNVVKACLAFDAGSELALDSRSVDQCGIRLGDRCARFDLRQVHAGLNSTTLLSPSRSLSRPRARVSPPPANEILRVPSPPG